MTGTTAFDAVYFDGASSARRAVRVVHEGGLLRISGEGVDAEVPLSDVKVEVPVAGSRHLLRLPAEAQLQTEDAAAVREIFPRVAGSGDWARRLEGDWGWALGSIAFIAAFAAWTIVFGIPWAARIAAAALPEAAGRELGHQTMQFLDRTFCDETLVAPARQREERESLARIAAPLAQAAPVRLEFRSCPPLGANAFALPGGTVVVTDDLVQLAAVREQLAAVLAHEAGHVAHDHAMRMALQAAGVAALVSTLATDAVSITGLAVALPTLLLESGYSRGFEEEADAFALERMAGLGIASTHFADILERLEESHLARAGAKDEKANRGTQPGDYFQTHPATAARIERARKGRP